MRRLIHILLPIFLLLPTAAPAQDAVLALVSRLLGPNVEIGEIAGDVTSRPVLRDLRLLDQEGVWLEIDEIAFTWSPASLLRRQVEISDVAATTVRMLRPPNYAEEQEVPLVEEPPTAEPAEERPFSEAITLPEFPVDLNLGQIAVERLELAEPVLGVPAALRVEGRISLERAGAGAELRLNTERLDAPGTAEIAVDIVPAEDRLQVAATLREPEGGLIARALNLPGLPPVEVTLSGSGPFSNWDGTLEAQAGTATLQADATLRRPPEAEGGTAFTLEGTADGGNLLPENWPEPAGRDLSFNIAGVFGPEGRFELAPGSVIRTDIGLIEVAGSADPAADRIDMRLELALTADAAELVEGVAWEQVDGTVAVTGTTGDPDLSAVLTLAEPRFDAVDAAARRAQLSVTIDPLSAARYRIAANGLLEQARMGGIPVEQPRDVAFELTALTNLEEEVAQVEALALRTDAAVLTADGQVGFDGGLDIAYRLESPQLADLFTDDVPLAGAVAVDGRVAGEAGELPTVTFDGTVRNLDTPYDIVDTLLGAEARVTGEVAPGPDDAFAFDLRAEGEAATLEAAGRTEGQRIDATFALELPRLAALPDLPVTGAARLEGSIEGPIDAPTVVLDLDATDLASEAFGTAARATVAARVEPLGGNRFGIAAEGQLQGLDVPGVPLDQPRDVDFDLRGAADLDAGAVTVEAATVETDGAVATAEGRIGFDGALALDFTLDAPQLGDLFTDAVPVGGAVDIQGRVEQPAGGRARVTVDGAVVGLDTPYDALDALLGDRATVAADLAPRAEEGYDFDLQATGVGARLATEGQLVDGRLAADLSLAIPDLGALPYPVSGDAELTGRVEGPLDALAAELELRGREIVAAGITLPSPVLNMDLTGLPDAPRGTFALSAAPEGVRVGLVGEIALAEGALVLDGLRFEAGDNVLTGDLRLDPATATASGALRGEFPDLSTLAPLAGTELAGQATLALDLGRTAEGVQTVALEIAGRELEVGGTRFETLEATATGTTEDLALRVEALAPTGPLAFAGRLELRDGTQRLTLTEAVAGIEGEELRLLQPAVIARTPAGFVVEDLALVAREGQVRADLEVTRDVLDGQVVIADLPLDLLNLLGIELTLGGTVSADLDLGGTPADPTATATLAFDDALVGPRGARDLFIIDARAEASWQGGRLDVVGTAQSDQPGIDLEIEATLPLVLSRDPFALDLPMDAPVEARIVGDILLDRFSDFFAAQGIQLGGDLAVDLFVGGTVAVPFAGGAISIDQGYFRSIDAGIVLTGIDGFVVGDGQRWLLEDLTAQTPEGGPLRADGSIELATLTDPVFDLRITGDNARLTETDIATVFGSPDVSLIGPLDALRLEGAIAISEAEIRIPRGLPPQVAELDYIDVNREVEEEEEEEPEADDAAPIAFDLVVSADNRVFVRGRGLDAEFGGRVEVGGTAEDPQITGGFQMLRGTFDLLGNRLVFSRGEIELLPGGGFNPVLDLVATTALTDATVQVVITGPPDDLDLSLVSDPPLPEDEALARLLFGRATTNLTAIQAIQLANAAATLSGYGGGGGIFGQVRDALGLTRLEVVGDAAETGGLGVAAGAYVGDRVYVEVEQGFAGETEIGVQVEVTDRITLETSVGPTSGSRVGVTVEWEY